MIIRQFTATNFRCLARLEIEPSAEFTLICGPNASGKTSILEAIAYLGRGRSFRAAAAADLIRHGQHDFVLFGRVAEAERETRVGVKNSPAGLDIRINGKSEGGSAALATAVPLQVIDPNVHSIVAGAPEERRRYLDWLTFHVEHGYLEAWRRFRRVLKQRNALLRHSTDRGALTTWTGEFVAAAETVDRCRRQALATASPVLADTVNSLDLEPIRFEYDSGWNRERDLAAILDAAMAREQQLGSTQHGPHRADIRLLHPAGKARRIVSRGQQKLLACAMILGATDVAQQATGKSMALLVDDPAAELDTAALERLMARVTGLGSQVIATALRPEALETPQKTALFHVKRGKLSVA